MKQLAILNNEPAFINQCHEDLLSVLLLYGFYHIITFLGKYFMIFSHRLFKHKYADSIFTFQMNLSKHFACYINNDFMEHV